MDLEQLFLLLLFSLTVGVQAQFYDIFQGLQSYQPTYYTTRRPDYYINQYKNPSTTHKSFYNNEEKHNSNERVRTTAKPHRKTTHANRYDLTYTTQKSIRKTTKISSTFNNYSNKVHETYVNNNNDDKTLNYYDADNDITKNKYKTTERYTEKYTTSRPVYGTTRSNVITSRPLYANNDNVYNINDNSRLDNDYIKSNNNVNAYYTAHQPGVRPANVDINKPPITNRPPALEVFPRVTDSSVIRFPQEEDTSPEVVSGRDEDSMTEVEKRRYIEMTEKMCDRYKELNVRKVEAIPLIPTPQPVQLNITVCPPTTIPLVVGGKVVTVEEFPHMAILGWINLERNGYSWKCGGSLISERFILTASHCGYQDKDDTVVIGAPRVAQLGSNKLDDPGALVVKVLTVIRHPKYIQTRSYYDVALVKLVEDVQFSAVVKPACLGVPPGVGEPIIATGWGRTEYGSGPSKELRSVSVPVWDMNECRKSLGTSRKMPQGPSRDSQICAGEKKGGKDTCQGDSGGPAQIQDGCVWRVIAVTSVGRSCGAPNTPALYATVHRAFIAAEIFKSDARSNNRNKNNNEEGINTTSRNINSNKHINTSTASRFHNSNVNDAGFKRTTKRNLETTTIQSNAGSGERGYSHNRNQGSNSHSSTRSFGNQDNYETNRRDTIYNDGNIYFEGTMNNNQKDRQRNNQKNANRNNNGDRTERTTLYDNVNKNENNKHINTNNNHDDDYSNVNLGFEKGVNVKQETNTHRNNEDKEIKSTNYNYRIVNTERTTKRTQYSNNNEQSDQNNNSNEKYNRESNTRDSADEYNNHFRQTSHTDGYNAGANRNRRPTNGGIITNEDNINRYNNYRYERPREYTVTERPYSFW